MKNLIFILTILFVSTPPSIAHRFCSSLLSSKNRLKTDGTESLIAYLSDLLEHRIIRDEDLFRFMGGLENGKILNPISDEKTSVSVEALIHHEGIQKYIDTRDLDQNRLLEWAKQSLQEKERIRKARKETRVVTQEAHQRMEFHPVPAGSFKRGEEDASVIVTLTHPFEMMSTLVTQKMWVDVMGKNPSCYVGPDHPVEFLTWWSAIEYANRISEKAGLKPVYDLSGLKPKPGSSAEAGNLKVESGEVKINAPDENIYLTEGYRLPTEAEMEYVMKVAGKANGKYHFGDDETELEKYAWYDANANGKTHPVAELKPLVIEGKRFYDLYGNVNEWVQDLYADQLAGGLNPQGAQTGLSRVFRGGSYCDQAAFLNSDRRGSAFPDYLSLFGFRLVRTKHLSNRP